MAGSMAIELLDAKSEDLDRRLGRGRWWRLLVVVQLEGCWRRSVYYCRSKTAADRFVVEWIAMVKYRGCKVRWSLWEVGSPVLRSDEGGLFVPDERG